MYIIMYNVINIISKYYKYIIYQKYANLATFKITVGRIRGLNYTLTSFSLNFQIQFILFMINITYFSQTSSYSFFYLNNYIILNIHNYQKSKSTY